MSGVQAAKPEVRLSARELAEYYCAQGDLMAARASIRRALEGAAAHRRLQAEQEEGYLKEVPLSVTLERSEYMLTVEGRADGIVPLAAQVHEIKPPICPLRSLTGSIIRHIMRSCGYTGSYMRWIRGFPA